MLRCGNSFCLPHVSARLNVETLSGATDVSHNVWNVLQVGESIFKLIIIYYQLVLMLWFGFSIQRGYSEYSSFKTFKPQTDESKDLCVRLNGDF